MITLRKILFVGIAAMPCEPFVLVPEQKPATELHLKRAGALRCTSTLSLYHMYAVPSANVLTLLTPILMA